MRPYVVPVEAFPQHHGLPWPEALRPHPILELRVVHPLEHDPRAGLAAGGGGRSAERGEEAARRRSGGVASSEGGSAPPEERQRRHGKGTVRELSRWGFFSRLN